MSSPALPHDNAVGGPHAVSDLAAVSVIIGFGLRTGLTAGSVATSRPSLVHTIVHDATIYFLVIFTSHLIFLSTLIFERVRNSIVSGLFLPLISLPLAHTPTPSRRWERRVPSDHDRTPNAFPEKSRNRRRRLVVCGNDNRSSPNRDAVCERRERRLHAAFDR